MYRRVVLTILVVATMTCPSSGQSITPSPSTTTGEDNQGGSGNRLAGDQMSRSNDALLWSTRHRMTTKYLPETRIVERLSEGLLLDSGPTYAGWHGSRYTDWPPRWQFGNLRTRIASKWAPPENGGTTTIRFTLGKGGQVESVRIELSSGQQITDKAAIDAIENAAPISVLSPSHSCHDIRAVFSCSPRKSITFETFDLAQPKPVKSR